MTNSTWYLQAWLAIFAFLSFSTAGAALDINSSYPLKYYGNVTESADLDFRVNQSGYITTYSHLNMSNNKIRGFFTTGTGGNTGQCANGEAVEYVNADGTYSCVDIDSQASGDPDQNLSEVLAVGNVANTSINMSGNSLGTGVSGGTIVINDTTNVQDIARFKEGGNVSIPNGNLSLGDAFEFQEQGWMTVKGDYWPVIEINDTGTNDFWKLHQRPDSGKFLIRAGSASGSDFNALTADLGGNVEVPNGWLNVSGDVDISDAQSAVEATIENEGTGGGNDDDANLLIKSANAGEGKIRFFHDGTEEWALDTGDGQGGAFSIRDQVNGQSNLKARQGGNVEIPNGNLSLSSANDIRFNGNSDTHWRIGRNIGDFTSTLSGNSLDITGYHSNDEGVVIGDSNGNEVFVANTDTNNVVIPNGDLNFANGNDIQDRGADAIQFDGSQNVDLPNGNLTITQGKLFLGDDSTRQGRLYVGESGGNDELLLQGTGDNTWEVTTVGTSGSATLNFDANGDSFTTTFDGQIQPGGDINIGQDTYLTISPSDTFSYDGNTVDNYGLGWATDSDDDDAQAYLAGYGGIKLFSASTKAVHIDASQNVNVPNGNLDMKETGSVDLNTDNLSGSYSRPAEGHIMMGAAGNDAGLIYGRTGSGGNNDGELIIKTQDDGDEPIIFQQHDSSAPNDPVDRLKITGAGNVEIPNGHLNVTGGDLDMGAQTNNISNFFDTVACTDYVKRVFANGSYACGTDDSGGSGGAEGLPQTLTVNSTANQSIDMFGNNITDSTRGNVTIGDSLKVYGNMWTQGADLAEVYRSPQDLSKGALVMISDQMQSAVERATAAGRYRIAGVVSTNPSHVMNYGEDGYPVALTGKAPVNVSLEHGPIKPGDPITVSSTPGVGTKAIQPGMVVGIALEPYTNRSTGTIDVFVNPRYYASNQARERMQGPADEKNQSHMAQVTQFLCDRHPDAAFCAG